MDPITQVEWDERLTEYEADVLFGIYMFFVPGWEQNALGWDIAANVVQKILREEY